ncbi:MAG: PEP/pyruvate-binding domain-containing protein [Elusimicrobia bacterium]|nr:PEP/pyruvate-binding domain-containing protein [Elusimicrobiota bacterium]
MTSGPTGPIDGILRALQERAKELQCLYHVNECLRAAASSREEVLRGILAAIPAGYQHSGICKVRLIVGEDVFTSPGFQASPWAQRADIVMDGGKAGCLEVFYTEARPPAGEGPFLKEERKLIDTLADNIAHYLAEQRGRADAGARPPAAGGSAVGKPDWWVIVNFLRLTDQPMALRLARKMVNHLCWSGVAEAHGLMQRFSPKRGGLSELMEDNRPLAKSTPAELDDFTEEVFRIADARLSAEEIVGMIQKWIRDDKVTFLLDALENPASTIPDLADSLQRYRAMGVDEKTLARPIRTALRAALMRRFFTEELESVNRAKECASIEDFCDVVQRVISPPGGHGRLGGKSSGLFLGAQVIRRSVEYAETLSGIKTPGTWYLASDALLSFIRHNELEDVYDRKYLEIDQVRREYPHIVQLFKNSRFPAELLKGFSMALDSLEDRPLIVRSSSLLEDRMGSAFSGKYKSLFLANQGSKKDRLVALTDAVAEVYASIFGPDAISYRAERNLLDMQEEMGIMIQEVVGSRVGDYFLPSYAGVAFSNNEFRWSPRIKRDDGLVRLVPGLGTRAVDRVGDDFPVLLAPGQPGLRVNASDDEVLRYAPRMVDLINLKTGTFDTIELSRLLRECGSAVPGIEDMVSIVDGGTLRRPVGLVDFEKSDCVVTFDGLISRTPFVLRVNSLLRLLRQKLGTPVDIEFASDGKDLYLLQCRPQSYGPDAGPADIPADIPRDRVLFTANRYVSNGRTPEITHVVYVDPAKYSRLEDYDDLKEVGRIVGRLNVLLPKRRFILMGPGRWGSRGDIKLGVGVTYSDISNTAALIEVARREGGYQPDLSFGTHFFQDLVEANIRYLPLYPDDDAAVFNEAFLTGAASVLAEFLPDRKDFSETVRVIDIPASVGGKILRLLMNGDRDEAVAFFSDPGAALPGSSGEPPSATRWL